MIGTSKRDSAEKKTSQVIIQEVFNVVAAN